MGLLSFSWSLAIGDQSNALAEDIPDRRDMSEPKTPEPKFEHGTKTACTALHWRCARQRHAILGQHIGKDTSAGARSRGDMHGSMHPEATPRGQSPTTRLMAPTPALRRWAAAPVGEELRPTGS